MNKYNILVIFLFACLNISCKNERHYDKLKLGEMEYEKTKTKALKYLYDRNINIDKAREIDTVRWTWVNDTINNDTIDSFSTAWGYLEAFDDIQQNKLMIVLMGPPPEPTWSKLTYKWGINCKINAYERPDSGALAYHSIMVTYIEKKYGIDFFENISLLRDSLNNLNESSRDAFFLTYKNKK